MSNKRKMIYGAAGAALLLIVLLIGKIGLIPLPGVQSVFQTPGTCSACHETWYDEASYAFNPQGNEKLPWGVTIGCAECHPVQYEEYKLSAMGGSKNALRPGCVNCHDDPHSVARWFKHMYLADPGWEQVQMGLRDRQVYNNELAPRLAEKARAHFLETDSRRCRECHLGEAQAALLKGTTGEYRPDIPPHRQMEKEQLTCVQCHQNLIHNLSVPAPWRGKPTRAQQGDVKAGKEKAEVCVGCHGSDTEPPQPGFPGLAGQSTNYLYMQLLAYKDGSRKDDTMEAMAASLEEADMADISAYYGELPLRPVLTRPKVLSLQQRADLERGEALYLDRCARCHGLTGKGQGVLPAVASQAPEYAMAQIDAFSSGRRSNHSIMRDVVKGMTRDDLELIARYLGTLK